jgi:hypothetical protein
MKQLLILTTVLILVFVTQNGLFAQSVKNEKTKPAVLVELFTSEGCPTCPPADRLLAKLEKEQLYANAEVITLALHVDYWNRDDWKDEYSSAIFSRRQDIYAQAFRTGQVFTPQMVIDGRSNFIGSNAAEATKAIVANSKNEKANVELSFENEKLKIEISKIPKHERSNVFLAIVEGDLKANKNRGEDYKHASIVRELKSLGMLGAEQNEFSAEHFVQINKDWKKENLKFVVFIQENQSRKVLGVNRIEAK